MAARFRAIRAEAADFGTNCLVSVSPNRRRAAVGELPGRAFSGLSARRKVEVSL